MDKALIPADRALVHSFDMVDIQAVHFADSLAEAVIENKDCLIVQVAVKKWAAYYIVSLAPSEQVELVLYDQVPNQLLVHLLWGWMFVGFLIERHQFPVPPHH